LTSRSGCPFARGATAGPPRGFSGLTTPPTQSDWTRAFPGQSSSGGMDVVEEISHVRPKGASVFETPHPGGGAQWAWGVARLPIKYETAQAYATFWGGEKKTAHRRACSGRAGRPQTRGRGGGGHFFGGGTKGGPPNSGGPAKKDFTKASRTPFARSANRERGAWGGPGGGGGPNWAMATHSRKKTRRRRRGGEGGGTCMGRWAGGPPDRTTNEKRAGGPGQGRGGPFARAVWPQGGPGPGPNQFDDGKPGGGTANKCPGPPRLA